MDIVHLDEKTIKALVNFNSLEEMNEAVREHRKQCYLSPSEQEILFVIGQYACKFMGVCYLSKQKIAEAAGFKSRRTAIRACNRMEQLGIIKQYETRRVRGDKRRSVNIIVIQQAIQNKTKSQEAVTVASHKKDIRYHAINKTLNPKEVTKTRQSDAQFQSLKKKIPARFFDLFSRYFDAQGIYDMYGILLRAKKSAQAEFLLEDHPEAYIKEFKNVYRLYRWGKVWNFKGYLYRTWQAISEKIKQGLEGVNEKHVLRLEQEEEEVIEKKLEGRVGQKDPTEVTEKNDKQGQEKVGHWWNVIQEEKAAEEEAAKFREKERAWREWFAEEKAKKEAKEALQKKKELEKRLDNDWWQALREGEALLASLREERGGV